MNRRNFMKSIFSGMPLIAAPSLAMGAYAINSSNKAYNMVKGIVIETDKAVINNCTFNIQNGDFAVYGDHQVVMSCSFNGLQTGLNIKAPLSSDAYKKSLQNLSFK